MHPTTILPGYLITLPQELCEALALKPGTRVAFSIHDGSVCLKAAPEDHPLPPRPVGLCKGEFTVPEDFNEIDLTGNPHESRSVGVSPTSQ